MLALLCYDLLPEHKVSNKRGVMLEVYSPDVQQISCAAITPDVLNQQHKHSNKKCKEQGCLWTSHRCSPSGHVSSPSLEYSIFCPASRPELIPTCLPNKLRRNCLSELSACLFFFSPRNAPDKKHIFTHKNEITGNLRARSFGGNACY